MGSYDALIDRDVSIPQTSAAAKVKVSFVRPGRTYSTVGSAYPTSESGSVVCQVWAVVGQKRKKAVPYVVATPGTDVPEPDKVVVIVYFADNPNTTFTDSSGGFVMHVGDRVTVLSSTLTALTGQNAVIEQIRPYSESLQIDVLIGTNVSNV